MVVTSGAITSKAALVVIPFIIAREGTAAEVAPFEAKPSTVAFKELATSSEVKVSSLAATTSTSLT
jgi:hypothetical protein